MNRSKFTVGNGGVFFQIINPYDIRDKKYEFHINADYYLKSIDYVFKGQKRFDSIFIAGDPEQREHNLSKAKYLLDWEPKNHHRDLV